MPYGVIYFANMPTVDNPTSKTLSELGVSDAKGVAEKFADQIPGANAGDKRTVDITMSTNVADVTLQGRTVQANFEVKDVKTLRMPELTHDFLHHYGVHSEEQFRELIRVVLNRRLEYLLSGTATV